MTPNQLTDTYLQQGLRSKLVALLSENRTNAKGGVIEAITDKNVLKAIGKIPRHYFFNTAFMSRAYEDLAFPIAAGQTISQPYTVAFQTQLLEIIPGDKILEIGTGSGYQTAVLMDMGGKVFTIERQKELFDKTKVLLPKMGYNPKFFYGDGYIGLEAYAPFDKILVTAGAPFIPDPLRKQLKNGGRLVIPVGEGANQEMILIERISDSNFKESKHGDFRFVPMLSEKNKLEP